MKLFYELGYRYFHMPWEMGPRPELVALVESGRITPGKAIDLGCGTGSNAIFLAQHGFEVTGMDYAVSAITKARRRAAAAKVNVQWVVDDLTRLQKVKGVFDFFVDYGTLDDLLPKHRDLYVSNMVPLTYPGSQFLLWCFEWSLRWWERWLARVSFFGALALEPGEVEQRFGQYFNLERIAEKTNLRGWPRGYGIYLMTRK